MQSIQNPNQRLEEPKPITVFVNSISHRESLSCERTRLGFVHVLAIPLGIHSSQIHYGRKRFFNFLITSRNLLNCCSCWFNFEEVSETLNYLCITLGSVAAEFFYCHRLFRFCLRSKLMFIMSLKTELFLHKFSLMFYLLTWKEAAVLRKIILQF